MPDRTALAEPPSQQSMWDHLKSSLRRKSDSSTPDEEVPTKSVTSSVSSTPMPASDNSSMNIADDASASSARTSIDQPSSISGKSSISSLVLTEHISPDVSAEIVDSPPATAATESSTALVSTTKSAPTSVLTPATAPSSTTSVEGTASTARRRKRSRARGRSGGKKAPVVLHADMSEEMQQEGMRCSLEAMKEWKADKDMAAYIKKEFDKKFGNTWHCIVGRNFGSFVTHESQHFLYFHYGQMAVLLFKAG